MYYLVFMSNVSCVWVNKQTLDSIIGQMTTMIDRWSCHGCKQKEW